jgi:sec-independent protein translocase protein TatB
VFNLSGSETIFLLLLALIVLGPEKLPEAIRRFGKTYGEVRKMATGFQSEMKAALDEPMRELKGTADALRDAAKFEGADEIVNDAKKAIDFSAGDPPSDVRPKRKGPDSAARKGAIDASRQVGSEAPHPTSDAQAAERPADDPPKVREPGINFGSANPRPRPQPTTLAPPDGAPVDTTPPSPFAAPTSPPLMAWAAPPPPVNGSTKDAAPSGRAAGEAPAMLPAEEPATE